MTNSPEKTLLVSLEARLAEFEKAIEDQFKPALRKAVADAIAEMADEFLADGFPGTNISVTEA